MGMLEAGTADDDVLGGVWQRQGVRVIQDDIDALPGGEVEPNISGPQGAAVAKRAIDVE